MESCPAGDDEPARDDPFPPAEHGRPSSRRFLTAHHPLPWVSLVIIAVLAGWHFWAATLSGHDEQTMIFRLLVMGAKVNALILEGEWWRLLASGLLHGTFTHLLVNCIGILLVGWHVERTLGGRTLAVTFVLSTISGALLSLWLTDTPSVGASGGMFGILGAAIAHGVLRFRQLPAVMRWYVVGFPAALGVASILYGLSAGNVDNHAHLGGLVVGVATGLVVPRLDRARIGFAAWISRVVSVFTLLSVLFVNGAMIRHNALAFDLPGTRICQRTGDTGYLHFYPSNWVSGAFREGKCLLGRTPGDGGIQCYVDPYYSVFLVARDEHLIQSPVGTEVFRRASPEDHPPGSWGLMEDHIFWHRDARRRLAFALMAFKPVAPKYAPLFSLLITEPAVSSPVPSPEFTPESRTP
jgi:membrane associated rhomboid family serine protease